MTRTGRIDMDGNITEFPVPLTSRGAILAGLAFDTQARLWVQQYVSPPAASMPVENDYLMRLGPELLWAAPGDLTGVGCNCYKAPSRGTVMHRISEGPDGAIWFSELGLKRIGRIDDSSRVRRWRPTGL